MNNIMSEKLPKRKDIRLKNYDYSERGAYFITICTDKRRKILSKIVGVGVPDDPFFDPQTVGVDIPYG